MSRRFFTVASNIDMTTLPIFDDARTNVIWAKLRIDNLDPFFREYARTMVSVAIKMVNADRPDYAQHIVAEAQPLPFPLGLTVGEIVRNLRASLDYAVCAMAVAQGASEAQASSLYFPISRDGNRYEQLVDNRTVKHGLGRLRPFFVDQVNATPTGNTSLWALNEIDRENKHRSIPVAITTVFAPLPDWPGAVGNAVSIQPGTKKEISIPRELYFEESHQFERTVYISFGRTSVFRGKPVIPVLNQLYIATVQMLDKIEAAYVAAFH